MHKKIKTTITLSSHIKEFAAQEAEALGLDFSAYISVLIAEKLRGSSILTNTNTNSNNNIIAAVYLIKNGADTRAALIAAVAPNTSKNIIDAIQKSDITEESVNEKFEEDSDPIEDLGIGRMSEIRKWAHQLGYTNEKEFLVLSAAKGKLEYVKYLVAKGADIHAENDETLIWASKKGHADIVEFLLAAGANVNAENHKALVEACEKGHVDDSQEQVENAHGKADGFEFQIYEFSELYHVTCPCRERL